MIICSTRIPSSVIPIFRWDVWWVLIFISRLSTACLTRWGLLWARARRGRCAPRGIPERSVVFRAEKPKERHPACFIYLRHQCVFLAPRWRLTLAPPLNACHLYYYYGRSLAQLAGSAIGINSLHPSSHHVRLFTSNDTHFNATPTFCFNRRRRWWRRLFELNGGAIFAAQGASLSVKWVRERKRQTHTHRERRVSAPWRNGQVFSIIDFLWQK